MGDDGLITVPGRNGQLLNQRPQLTSDGRRAVDRLLASRRERLAELLDGWSPDEHDELCKLIDRLTQELLDDEEAPGPRPRASVAAVASA